MIIAALVISVLSIAVSLYSAVMTRRAAKARQETERLRAERQAPSRVVLDFSHGNDAILAAIRNAIKKRPEND